jgi:nitrogen fixation negative regulator NifL
MDQATLLIVEDDPQIAFLIHHALTSYGYQVLPPLATGEAAIERVRQSRPDLVLMDIGLSGAMDGIAAAQEITSHFQTPIIYLTANTDDTTLDRAKVTEPLSYIIKPFRARDLCITVEMALHHYRLTRQLQAAEAQLRYKASLMKYMPDAVIVTDAAYNIQELNPAAEALYGWPADEVIGRPLADVLPTTFAGTSLEAVLSEFQSVGFWRGEAIQQTRSGRLVYVNSAVSTVTGPDGRIAGIMAVNHDVTARREAEAERIKLAHALENTVDLVYITDISGKIEYANQAFEEVTGYSREEAVGHTPSILRSGEHSQTFYETLWRTILAGQPFKTIFTNRKKNGDIYYEDRAITPLKDDQGQITHFISSGRDITERLQTQQALKEQEAFNRSVLNSLTGHIAVLDRQGKIVAANWAWDDFALANGATELELVGVGLNYLEICRRTEGAESAQAQHCLEGLQAVMDGRIPSFDIEYPCHSPTEERWFLMRVVPLASQGGGLVVSHIDITGVKRLERRLIQSEKLSALGRLTASIAHEINNPLQSVQGCLTLVQEELQGQQRQEKLDRYLGIVKKEIDRISGIVRQMRDYYRPVNESTGLIDVHQVLQSVLDLSAKQLQHSEVFVSLEWGEIPPIWANPNHLKQVFLNLLLNALDAMPAGGVLRLQTSLHSPSASAGDAMVLIAFADSGVGMPADLLNRLFEPFFTTKPHGSGLGLSISYNIIETHGGQITVGSKEGEGTVVTVLLPLRPPSKT